MPIAIIDGRELEFPAGERLNAIQAAERVGIQVPYYCWHPGLTVAGSCRMCLVEAGTRNAATGEISMMPKLVPGCNTPVRDGVVIVTQSEKVQQARAMVEEDLLLRHPIDCPICDKAGECLLQDYHFKYGQDERRADIRPFTSRRRDVGDVTLFVDRCILCSRCVRFCREISGTSELTVVHRGAHEEIDVAPGFPLHNNLSGNVVDLCPVGALGDKDFLYRQRVWYLKRHQGICTGCATGCSIWVEENQDRIHRLKPRENPQVNQWWICNEGRYSYPHVHNDRRLAQPRRRDTQAVVDLDWTTLPAELLQRLREAGRLAAVLSPYLSVEEAYLLATLVRGVDPEARLILGPVPVIGEDERFPNGFTVSAEKCPNRRGVEEIIARFQSGRITTFDAFPSQLKGGRIGGVWFSGGYKKENWIEDEKVRSLTALKLLVVQDLFPSAVSALATYELPGAAFAERDGSYVNRNDHLQSVRWAVRPPYGVRPEGTLYWEMLGRPGLYNARAVLNELAAEIPYFHVAGGPVPDVGVNLKVNLLAEQPEEIGVRS
ncbi:MAG: (2Fe-2S)-binding protein [Pirellulales bacterium]|nr:(2Fe-2S)-binding protein [Pirellulales bacterium]